MLKRRDWLHLHGNKGGASSSDDDSDENSSESTEECSEGSSDADGEAADTDASDEGADSEGLSGDIEHGNVNSIDDDDDRPRKRMARSFDDISDPDEDEEASEEDDVSANGITADHVVKAWTSDDPQINSFKGIPLRCTCCDALLLNRTVFLGHVASKKHLRQLKHFAPGAADPLQLASETTKEKEEKEEEAETHAERLERISRLAVAGSAGLSKPPRAVTKGKAGTSSPPQQPAKGAKVGKTIKAAAASKKGVTETADSSDDGGDDNDDVDDEYKRKGEQGAGKINLKKEAAQGGGARSKARDKAGMIPEPPKANVPSPLNGGGEVGVKSKRKRHGTKMGKRERMELQAAIAAGKLPAGTKPVTDKGKRKGKALGEGEENRPEQEPKQGRQVQSQKKQKVIPIAQIVAEKQTVATGAVVEPVAGRKGKARALGKSTPEIALAAGKATLAKGARREEKKDGKKRM